MLNCINSRSEFEAEAKKVHQPSNYMENIAKYQKTILFKDCHKYRKTNVIFRTRWKFQIRISVQIWNFRFTVDQCNLYYSGWDQKAPKTLFSVIKGWLHGSFLICSNWKLCNTGNNCFTKNGFKTLILAGY